MAHGFAGEPGRPKPDLAGLGGIREDEQMLGSEGGDGFFQLLAFLGCEDAPLGHRRHVEHLHSTFFRNDLQLQKPAIEGHAERTAGFRPIPADGGIGEQAGEIEGLEVSGGFLALLGVHGEIGVEMGWEMG